MEYLSLSLQTNSLCLLCCRFMYSAEMKRLILNQQYLAALRQIAIVFPPPRMSAPFLPFGSSVCCSFGIWGGFCHVRLYDQVTKEINRKSMFATFCESVFGVFELMVRYVFVCLFGNLCFGRILSAVSLKLGLRFSKQDLFVSPRDLDSLRCRSMLTKG